MNGRLADFVPRETWNSPDSEFAQGQVEFARQRLNREDARKNPRRMNIAICKKDREDYPGYWREGR
jgi:hypothetical protein